MRRYVRLTRASIPEMVVTGNHEKGVLFNERGGGKEKGGRLIRRMRNRRTWTQRYCSKECVVKEEEEVGIVFRTNLASGIWHFYIMYSTLKD